MAYEQDFWQQLSPHLLSAGLVQHLDPESQVRVEAEKARVQELARIERGVPQSLEKLRWGSRSRSYRALLYV